MELAWWFVIGLFGAIAGNLATSPLYRWPRQVALTREKPYCDSCFTPLTPRDLFPIISWWLNRGKCRTCSAPIPAIYMLIELLFCTLFLAIWQRYGMGENFLLLAFSLGAGILFAALLWQNNFWGWPCWYALLVGGLLWRSTHEYTLAGAQDSLLIAGTVALIWWHHSGSKKEEKTNARYQGLLLPVILVWIPLVDWLAFGISWAMFAGLLWLILTLIKPSHRHLCFCLSGVFALQSWLLGLTDLLFSL